MGWSWVKDPTWLEHSELVSLYWSELEKVGSAFDDDQRTLMRMEGVPEGEEGAVRRWIELVVGKELGEGPLMGALRTGEVLCDLINCIHPGVVTTITRFSISTTKDKAQG